MRQRQWINRIVALWLFAALGLTVSQSRSLADCQMNTNGSVAAEHACCMKSPACGCVADDSQMAPSQSTPVSGRIQCQCEVEPQPENSAPQVEPVRLYVVAALPPRAGPAFIVATVTSAISATTLSVVSNRIVPPSSPRAPPF
jgi:hypothetical protein